MSQEHCNCANHVAKEHAAPPALFVDNVYKNFGGVYAVNGAYLSVPVGERRSLVGPNGAGKTSLFNCITGKYDISSGSVHFLGKDITKTSVRERALLGMGRSYQISRLFWELSVQENIVLAASGGESMFSGMLTAWWKTVEKREWAEKIAEDVGLSDVLAVSVRDLSHGQQRQLELGMTLAMRPKLILLDEPAAGLSPSERVIVRRLLAELSSDITVLLIEHDMDVVLDFSDKITVLHQGAVCAEGTPDEIRNNERVQQVYLGTLYE